MMLAGYSYLAPGCPEVPAENLRLAEIWIGLPLLALRPRIPDVMRDEKNLVVEKSPIELGPLFLYDPANRTEAMLMASRLAVAASAVVLGWILFAASRRLHGPAAGILTLTLYCLNPVIISNSAVATVDLATALLFTVTAAAYWRMIHRPSPLWTAALGISLGALLTTKFTGVIFPAIAAVLLAVRWAAGPRPLRAWRLALAHAVAAVVAYGVIWLVYGFHYAHGASVDASYWAQPDSGPAARLVDMCRRGHLLPEAYLYDIHLFLGKLQRLCFFMGRYSIVGFWSFFPLVTFFKSPPALLLALCLGSAAAVPALRRNLILSPPGRPLRDGAVPRHRSRLRRRCRRKPVQHRHPPHPACLSDALRRGRRRRPLPVPPPVAGGGHRRHPHRRIRSEDPDRAAELPDLCQ